jgi:hypothetical protein
MANVILERIKVSGITSQPISANTNNAQEAQQLIRWWFHGLLNSIKSTFTASITQAYTQGLCMRGPSNGMATNQLRCVAPANYSHNEG